MYKLGIVGFGVVGKSLLAFLNKQKIDCSAPAEHELFSEQALFHDHTDTDCIHVYVWDQRILTDAEREIIALYKAQAVDASKMSLCEFIKSNDFIISSPGVSLAEYKEFSNKFLCELDFFADFFTKPIVAVTGSLGKTTITRLLAQLLSLYQAPSRQGTCHVLMGGNVGIAMLDLIQNQESVDFGVLELSSFQLEMNKKFAPDIAVWTNWYANHLDWHGTPEDYFHAKSNMMRFQNERQHAVLSIDLFKEASAQWLNSLLPQVKSVLSVCSVQKPSAAALAGINRETFSVFYFDEQGVLVKALVEHKQIQSKEEICKIGCLPDITFAQNWIQIITSLYLLRCDVSLLPDLFKQASSFLDDNHHRLEHCATINGVDFYNDSKSTVMQATQAAFEKLSAQERPIILILGGLGKGVDRSSLIKMLTPAALLKKTYCFGKECAVFSESMCCVTLDEVMQDVAKIMQPNDIVLFSPSGTSFDLFKDYKHRGQVFKDLVKKIESPKS